ncbi:hypothetical protein F5879DRAFT_927900 [Lentinula edodes]|nr:hypothetical protein F5879DRAFT_927900 [Lentinula edodes]
MRRAREQVRRIKERKAEEAARRKAAEEAAKKKEVAARAGAVRKKAAQETQAWVIRAQQQEDKVVERRRLLANAATTRSQRGTSPSEISASPRRPVVEIRRMMKGKGKAKAQPIGGDPNDSNEEERTPCK